MLHYIIGIEGTFENPKLYCEIYNEEEWVKIKDSEDMSWDEYYAFTQNTNRKSLEKITLNMKQLEWMEDFTTQKTNYSHNYYKFVKDLTSLFFRTALLKDSYIEDFLNEYNRIKDPHDCILWDLPKENESILDTKQRRRSKFEEFNGNFGQEMYNNYGFFKDLYGPD